jgi:hypothetical protein
MSEKDRACPPKNKFCLIRAVVGVRWKFMATGVVRRWMLSFLLLIITPIDLWPGPRFIAATKSAHACNAIIIKAAAKNVLSGPTPVGTSSF